MSTFSGQEQYSADGRDVNNIALYNINSDDNPLMQTTNSTPNRFVLYQNYPNPFNPKSVINYSIGLKGKVVVNVYDLLGRLVKTLVNEFKDAGNYSTDFDGTNLASGLYLYRIESGDFTETKKMLLIK